MQSYKIFFDYANTAEDESSLNVDNANPGEQKVSLSGEEHGVIDAAIDLEKQKASRAVGFRLKSEWDSPDCGRGGTFRTLPSINLSISSTDSTETRKD